MKSSAASQLWSVVILAYQMTCDDNKQSEVLVGGNREMEILKNKIKNVPEAVTVRIT